MRRTWGSWPRLIAVSLSQYFSVGKRRVPCEAAVPKAAHCNTFKGMQPGERGSRIQEPEDPEIQLRPCTPRTRAPARRRDTLLVSDEVRKEISEDPEKSQPRDAVGGENPGAAAFTCLPAEAGWEVDCSETEEETTGARSSMQETSERKDRGASTLCVTPARRRARQDYLRRILLRF